jgi:hypothetical protein
MTNLVIMLFMIGMIVFYLKYTPKKKEQVCTYCGHVGDPTSQAKGSILIEIILWLCFLIPGLIYSIWRMTSKQKVCPSCGHAGMIPIDSPKGRELAKASKPLN